MTFGERLILARENKGYKQKQFAEMLNITPTRLNYWEKNKREPDVLMIKKISSLLDVSSDWLIGNIKKYRTLDEYGKKAIDNLLDTEYERCQNENKLKVLQLPMSELKASAGTGNWLEDNTYNTVEVADTPSARKADLIIEVSGDSMEPTYSDGDNVLVRLQPSVDIGEIGIFIKDNEGYIKELGKNRLISHNKDYPDMLLNEFNDVRCVGKVIGLAEMV